MSDGFHRNTDTVFAPARSAFAVVPDDEDELPRVPKGIFVGTGGDVTLRAVDSGADVVYRNLPDASYIAVRVSHVRATGTTATDMVAEA